MTSDKKRRARNFPTRNINSTAVSSAHLILKDWVSLAQSPNIIWNPTVLLTTSTQTQEVSRNSVELTAKAKFWGVLLMCWSYRKLASRLSKYASSCCQLSSDNSKCDFFFSPKGDPPRTFKITRAISKPTRWKKTPQEVQGPKIDPKMPKTSTNQKIPPI